MMRRATAPRQGWLGERRRWVPAEAAADRTVFHLDVGYLELVSPVVVYRAPSSAPPSKAVVDYIQAEIDCRLIRHQMAARDALWCLAILERLRQGPATTGQLIDAVGWKRQSLGQLLARLRTADIVNSMRVIEAAGQYNVWSLVRQPRSTSRRAWDVRLLNGGEAARQASVA